MQLLACFWELWVKWRTWKNPCRYQDNMQNCKVETLELWVGNLTCCTTITPRTRTRQNPEQDKIYLLDLFCHVVYYACRRRESVTYCKVMQKQRWSLIICRANNNVEGYRFWLMNSITDTNTKAVCCGLHTLVNRLDIVDESRAEMELAERNFIQTVSLSGSESDMSHVVIRFR